MVSVGMVIRVWSGKAYFEIFFREIIVEVFNAEFGAAARAGGQSQLQLLLSSWKTYVSASGE